MGRIVRILVTLGLVAVVIVVIRRLMGGAGNPPPSTTPWEPVTPESPLATTTPETAAGSATTDGSDATGADRGPTGGGGAAGDEATGWVEPEAEGSCPAGFPVKAKLSSKIFHVPGGGSYERTSADRCYRDPAAAEADGLRQAKR